MNKNHFTHKKRLGQNFLNNDVIIANIVGAAESLENKTVIEIGPGAMALTKELVKISKKVIAIEKDLSLKDNLEKFKLKHSNFDYIIADALFFDPVEQFNLANQNNILISNLPYNVGTQIYLNYLTKYNNFDYFVLMFQLEVAKRIIAEPNTSHYGRLSIISEFLSKNEFLFEVDKENFTPPPKVQSAVIKVYPYKKESLDLDLLNKLEKLTHVLFQGKRKIIRNTLKNIIENIDDNNQLKGYLSLRPQELNLEQMIQLAKIIDI